MGQMQIRKNGFCISGSLFTARRQNRENIDALIVLFVQLTKCQTVSKICHTLWFGEYGAGFHAFSGAFSQPCKYKFAQDIWMIWLSNKGKSEKSEPSGTARERVELLRCVAPTRIQIHRTLITNTEGASGKLSTFWQNRRQIFRIFGDDS